MLDLTDDQQNVIGFEVVQDFRMSNWGQSCNYRYEQHVQFFNDGRFRVVSGAYGKACGLNAIYRPVVRIDIAVDGNEGDSFAFYNGRDGWIDQETELYRTPATGSNGPHSFTDEGYAWKVADSMGSGYFIEPGRGQFGDDGRGDDPFIYVTQHDPAQDDADLGVFGACCNDNHQQGPDEFINGESIKDENIVVWYVPQMITDAEDSGDGFYCWTLLTEDDPGPAYPCFSGPMFVPFDAGVELFIPYAVKPEDS